MMAYMRKLTKIGKIARRMGLEEVSRFRIDQSKREIRG
jgi:hypothetical protein